MPRIPQGHVAGHAYHVLNRGNGDTALWMNAVGLPREFEPSLFWEMRIKAGGSTAALSGDRV